MSSNDKNKPMDPTATEGEYRSSSSERKPYAMEQLISEVEEVYPGMSYETSRHNAWGVLLDIQFTPEPDDARDFGDLMTLLTDSVYSDDLRIEGVIVEDSGVLVSFRDRATTFDLRDPFGLVKAHAVLTGGAL